MLLVIDGGVIITRVEPGIDFDELLQDWAVDGLIYQYNETQVLV